MTPDEMLFAWRALIAQNVDVTFEPYYLDRHQNTQSVYCCITVFDVISKDFESNDADPLRAFEKAYRAYQEGKDR